MAVDSTAAFMQWHNSLSAQQKADFAATVAARNQPPAAAAPSPTASAGLTKTPIGNTLVNPGGTGRGGINIGFPERNDPNTPFFDPNYNPVPVGSLKPGADSQYAAPMPFDAGPDPEIDPAQDPAYLAYQRTLQQSEENMRADIARQIAAMQQKVAAALPVLDQQRERGTRDIQYRHAGNGTFSSSSRLGDENRLQSDVDRQKNDLQSGQLSTEDDLQSTLTRYLAENQAKLSEQAIAARQRLGGQAAQTQAAKKSNYLTNVGQQQRARAAFAPAPRI